MPLKKASIAEQLKEIRARINGNHDWIFINKRGIDSNKHTQDWIKDKITDYGFRLNRLGNKIEATQMVTFLIGVVVVTVLVLNICSLSNRLDEAITASNRYFDRIPDNGQTIATTCYVDSAVSDCVQKPEYAGYFIAEDGERHEANALDFVDDKVKVRYLMNNEYSSWGWIQNVKEIWIPLTEWKPYYTLEEIAERLNQ